MYQAVIFDLDGTLLNTIDDICDSLNYALEKYGYSTHDVEETKAFVGSGVRIMVERALKFDNASEETKELVLKAYLEMYSKKQADKTKPYDGVITMIKSLRSLGLKIGLLSNKPHEDTLKIINKYFGLDLFDIVLGQRPGVPIKPNPTALYEIIDNLKAKKEQCLFVGDSDVDMQTAQNAKMDKIAVLWGFRTKEVVERYNPNYIVSNPQEILKFIK